MLSFTFDPLNRFKGMSQEVFNNLVGTPLYWIKTGDTAKTMRQNVEDGYGYILSNMCDDSKIEISDDGVWHDASPDSKEDPNDPDLYPIAKLVREDTNEIFDVYDFGLCAIVGGNEKTYCIRVN